jgi:hypothetical protein
MRFVRLIGNLDDPRHVFAAAPSDIALGDCIQKMREIRVEVPEPL